MASQSPWCTTSAALAAMLERERNSYRKCPPNPSVPLEEYAVDRRLMISWCRRLVSECGFGDEIVHTAVSHADRFMSSPSLYEYAKAHYQLIVITCLYVAIKMDSPSGAPTSSDVSHICRGAYTAEEVDSEELCILQGLDWRLAPPTAPQIVAHILDLVDGTVDRDAADYGAFVDRVDRQLEASLSDLNLLRPSTIAVAAVLNSLEHMTDASDRQAVLMSVMSIANRLDFDPIYDIDAVRHDLAYLASAADGQDDDAATADSSQISSLEDEDETTADEDVSVRSPTSAVHHVAAAYCEPVSADGPASSSVDYYCRPVELFKDDDGGSLSDSDDSTATSIDDEVMEDMVRAYRRQLRRSRRKDRKSKSRGGGLRRRGSNESSCSLTSRSSFYSSCSTLDRIPEEVDVDDDERQVSFLTLR